LYSTYEIAFNLLTLRTTKGYFQTTKVIRSKKHTLAYFIRFAEIHKNRITIVKQNVKPLCLQIQKLKNE